MNHQNYKYLKGRLESIKRNHLFEESHSALPVIVKEAKKVIRRYDAERERLRQKRRNKVEAAASRIMEKIVLDDAPGALSLLAKFEKARFRA